jgi:hypothetical protein
LYNIKKILYSITIVITLLIHRQIHLQLIEVCQEADAAFALQILSSIIMAFAVITANLYILYTEIISKDIPRQDVFDTIIIVTIWNIFYAVKISIFSSTCSNCIEQVIINFKKIT